MSNFSTLTRYIAFNRVELKQFNFSPFIEMYSFNWFFNLNRVSILFNQKWDFVSSNWIRSHRIQSCSSPFLKLYSFHVRWILHCILFGFNSFIIGEYCIVFYLGSIHLLLDRLNSIVEFILILFLISMDIKFFYNSCDKVWDYIVLLLFISILFRFVLNCFQLKHIRFSYIVGPHCGQFWSCFRWCHVLTSTLNFADDIFSVWSWNDC